MYVGYVSDVLLLCSVVYVGNVLDVLWAVPDVTLNASVSSPSIKHSISFQLKEAFFL